MENLITGAEALMRSLEHQGVKTIFGYPGGSIMPVFDALYDHRKNLNHILVRHEQGATHAAQGFARVSGEVGVCLVTSGPGATNTITGIAGKKGFVSITIDKDMMNSEIGFGRKVLQVFEDNGISFEHMPSGIDTMTVFVHQDEFVEKEQKVLAQLHRAVNPDSIELESDLSLIAVVGRGMRNNSGLAANIFSALAKAKINIKMIDQGSSELNIIIGVRNRYFEDAIKTIYDVFVPNNK